MLLFVLVLQLVLAAWASVPGRHASPDRGAARLDAS
jgi:hypothetical protein